MSIRLLTRIAAHGHFAPHGPNFNRERIEALRKLLVHYPELPVAVPPAQTLSYWKGQFAFLLKSNKYQHGHLMHANGKMAYVRIPKAGNTSMAFSILQSRFPYLDEQVLGTAGINYLTDYFLEKESRPEEIFAVVRNPFARIVSVYRDFLEQDQGRNFYGDYLFGFIRKPLSFPEFVARIALIPDRLKDQHLKPQYTFLNWYKSQGIQTHIFQLEKPAVVAEFLGARGMKLNRLNSTGNAYDYRQYYDEQSLSDVQKMYRQDLKEFGYEQSCLELKTYLATQKPAKIT